MPVRHDFLKIVSFVIILAMILTDILYIQKSKTLVMRNTQLLSVVFSLIMFTGVTASSMAFADTDDLEDRLEDFCEMNIEQRSDFFTDYPDMAEYDEKLSAICEMADEDEREDALDDFIFNVVLARDEIEDDFDDKYDELEDDRDNKYHRHADLEDRLKYFCDMTDEEKRQLFADHPRLEQFSDRLANYCDLSEDERKDKIDDFIREHTSDTRDHDKYDLDDMLKRFCDMTNEDKRKFFDHYPRLEQFSDRILNYCEISEDERDDAIDKFIAEHKDVMHDYMKEKIHDKMTDIMDYDRLCSMAASDRVAEITDVATLDRISKWCNMTPEERDDYKEERHDDIKDKVTDRIRMSDMSPRLKAMIMENHEISDEKREEIKMKYREKHGEVTDELKSELKIKFKDHMTKVKIKMSDERRSAIHDRLADMKAFKAELREKASEMTNEEKQKLREEFIEKAKDMQLAWISPRTQITAGIDASEVECREGFSLVMKASNGVPMCLKSDTALKMIDRGIVVPAN
jgi:hypothetical protein